MAEYVHTRWTTGERVNEIKLDRMQSNMEYHREGVIDTRVLFTGEPEYQYDDLATTGWKVELNWGTGVIYTVEGGSGSELITGLNIDAVAVPTGDRELDINIYSKRSGGDVLAYAYEQQIAKVGDQRYLHIFFTAEAYYHIHFTVKGLTVLSSKNILVMG